MSDHEAKFKVTEKRFILQTFSSVIGTINLGYTILLSILPRPHFTSANSRDRWSGPHSYVYVCLFISHVLHLHVYCESLFQEKRVCLLLEFSIHTTTHSLQNRSGHVKPIKSRVRASKYPKRFAKHWLTDRQEAGSPWVRHRRTNYWGAGDTEGTQRRRDGCQTTFKATK